MRRAALLIALVLALGLGVGWATAVMAPQPAGATARAPTLRDGRELAKQARERFMALGLAQPPLDPAALEAPPPPDIAVVFRRDLTAIERTPSGPVAWIVDLDDMAGRRALKRGDVYQDWTVAAITEQTIELRRGDEVRRIAVFEAPQETPP